MHSAGSSARQVTPSHCKAGPHWPSLQGSFSAGPTVHTPASHRKPRAHRKSQASPSFGIAAHRMSTLQ